jgi:hypothetical protein
MSVIEVAVMRVTIIALTVLAGCVQSDAAMRAKPASRQFTSDKTADSLVACLVPSISASYRGAYDRKDMFVANVRAPGREYDIVTPNAAVGGQYTFLVNVRDSVVSIYEVTPIASYMRDGLISGIEPCL